VNVASKSGHTFSNYRQLREMYDELNDKGLEILAFPTNQFGNEEPGTNDEIQEFCKGFGITFPVFGKVSFAAGGLASPLRKYADKLQ
jgi:glutathione peroxidase